METINIQLKQLTTEPDGIPQLSTHPDNDERPQEFNYDLMRDTPDNYLSDNIQTSPVLTENLPENHHPTLYLAMTKTTPFR